MKEDYQKTLKKSTLVFLSNPVPFNGQNYQKQKGSDTSDQSLLRLRNKFKNISLFIIYYCLTKLDDGIKTSFWAIPKNYICKFMQVSWWHRKLLHFHLSFWNCKLWKGRKKTQKFEYLEKEKSFLGEIKKNFHSF